MNRIELALWLVSMIICYRIIADKNENKKKTVFGMLLYAFALFVLMYKATQYDITDSEKYLHKFVALKDVKSIYPDALYQYRITLLITGMETILFRILRIDSFLSVNTREQLGLATHVFLSFILLLFIVMLAFRCFLKGKVDKNKEALFFTVMPVVFVCCPVLLLEMRTYNYDSFAMMLGILALELVATAIKEKDRKWLWGSIMIATLAAFEKIMAGPVLLLCIVLSGILECQEIHNIRQTGTIVKNVVIGILIYLFTAILLQVGIEWMIVREPGNSIHLLSLFYPLCSSFDVLSGNFAYSDIQRECVLLTLAVCACIALGIAGKLFVQFMRKHTDRIWKVLPVMNAVALLVICVVGIISTYAIQMKIYPYDSFGIGESQVCPRFSSVYYHYGATTAFGQYFCHFCNAMACIMNKITTGHLFLILLYIMTVRFQWSKASDVSDLLPHLGISLSITMCILYAIAGVPSDSRYKSLYIGVLFICCVIVIIPSAKISDGFNKKETKKKMAILALGMLAMTEIILYAPNEMAFKPIWNINCSKYPRQGVWDAGEPMQWGIQNMLVGEQIKKWADREKVAYSDITIYCDYGGAWFENPGMNIEYVGFTERRNQSKYNFYIQSRFVLYRKEIPEYIYQEVPFMEINYRGETATWVYLVVAE